MNYEIKQHGKFKFLEEGKGEPLMLLHGLFGALSNFEYLIEYFKNKYTEDEWVHGGALKYKGSSLIRDLYSNKLKVCVEYDGVWHFKDINGQLEEKKRKDSLLEEWCLDNNFRLIRIKEEVFYSNKELYLKYIEDLIYGNSAQIVKIYDFLKIEKL